MVERQRQRKRKPSTMSPTTPGRAEAPRHATVNSESTFRAVVEAALHPIITIDAYGVILSASSSLERVFGWTPAQLVGQNISVLMPPPHNDAHDSYIERYRQTGETTILNKPRRFDARRKDGTIFPIELSVSRADTPTGDSWLFVGIVRDLSDASTAKDTELLDRVRLQDLVTEQTQALHAAHLRLRLADRMASIGTLAAGLGHDMKNVLLPIRAHLNALAAAQADLDPTQRREHVDKVLRGVGYLQRLADGLHDLTMDPDNEQEAQPATCLQSWWVQTGTLIAKAVPRHVRVTASFPPDLPEVAVAAHQLTQAVLNLVVNAGEAIPAHRKRRQGTVRLTADSCEDQRQVVLVVTDNGIGMSEEVKRRAFDAFFTTKPRGLGTGLGLALVRKVVQRAGGFVEIDSEIDKGTKMTMTLPAIKRPDPCCGRPIARIAIADPRAATLVVQLLQGAGACIDEENCPERTDIWIIEPRQANTIDLERWRRKTPAGQLVLLGAPEKDTAEHWAALRPVIITNPDDFKQVQATLHSAVAAL